MAGMTVTRRKPFDVNSPSWARIVSDVLSPPVVWVAMVLILAFSFTASATEALYWSALYSLFICVIPVAFIFLMVATGRIGDIHMKERHERYLPFALSLVCAIVACVLLRTLNAPPVFRLISVLTLVEIAILALITLFWQISMHAMSITCVVVAAGVAFQPLVGIVLVPLIMLVGAARLMLKRHTPMQIFFGALLGAAIPISLLMLLPITMLI